MAKAKKNSDDVILTNTGLTKLGKKGPRLLLVGHGEEMVPVGHGKPVIVSAERFAKIERQVTMLVNAGKLTVE